MNMEMEKKWFVYVGDHHEGPFSIPEMAARQDSGEVTSDSYVWCEGMADWLMLSQVNELEQGLREFKEASQPAATPVSSRKESVATAPAPKSVQKKNKRLPLILTAIFLVLVIGGLASLVGISRSSNEELHASIRPLLSRLVQNVPALGSLFQLIPTLPDVKEDEFFELQAANTGALREGARVAIALSTQDANRPFFYVSTNLPHGIKFEIQMVGQADTLLNRLQFSTQGTLATSQGFGKSEVFLAEGGQLIPKGRYMVYLMEASEQDASMKEQLAQVEAIKFQGKLPASIPSTAKFVVAKSLFLGGERDETYLTRLKAFHDKIRANSEKELQELKQYSQTLDFQFNTLTTDFQRLFSTKKATATLRNSWKKNLGLWTQISTQLDQSIQTWSPETLKNEFFYGKVYELVKSAFQSLKSLIQLESEQLEKPGDKAAFEIQHGKMLSDTRQALEMMKQKVDFASKIPKNPAGLPSREGL
jgi:hypothetical protein